MTYRKEIITRLTALVLSLSMMTTAYAVKPNEVTEPLENTGTTAVTLTVLDSGGDGEGPGTGGDEGFIIATVPAELPIVMDLQGKITVPNDAKIINHLDESNIEIINIDTIMGDGWEIADFRDDFKSKQENSKELGLRLRGDELSTDGSFNLTDGNWVVAKDEGVLQLQMAAKLPKQSETSRTQIATVQFTLDLTNKEASIDKPVIPEEPEEQSTITNDWGKDRVLKSSVTPVVISYDSTLADVRIVSVESNSPSVTVEKSKQKRSLGNPGEEVWNVKAVSKGAATITAELSTGDTTSFDVMVYELELDDGGTVTVPEIPNKGEGDKLITGDLVIDIPIQTPDGKDKITVTPTIPDGTVLEEGDNTIDTTVTVDGVTINITINITIQSSNPSDGLHQSIEDAQAMGFTFSSYEDGLQIDSFDNKQFKSEINVPEQIGDFKVLKINDNAFSGQSNLARITLPKTINEIGTDAFKGCSSLSLALPSEDISVGLGLGDIKELYVKSLTPNRDISGVAEAIGSGVDVYVNNVIFTDTEKLKLQTVTVNYKDVTMWFLCIGDTGEVVEARPLNFNTGKEEEIPFTPSIFGTATDVVYPKYINGVLVEKIPRDMFPNYMSLKTLYLPDSIKEAESGTSISTAIYTSENKGSIIITINNTEGSIKGFGSLGSPYYSDVFIQYTNTARLADGKLQFPVGITEIPKYYCNGVSIVESVEIPSSVVTIGTGAFSSCNALTSVVINDGVKTIGEAAFAGIGVSSLKVPDTVTTIGPNAFKGISQIYYNGSAEGAPWGALKLN